MKPKESLLEMLDRIHSSPEHQEAQREAQRKRQKEEDGIRRFIKSFTGKVVKDISFHGNSEALIEFTDDSHISFQTGHDTSLHQLLVSMNTPEKSVWLPNMLNTNRWRIWPGKDQTRTIYKIPL